MLLIMAVDFATWLLHELEKRDWSQSELARRSGTTPTHVSRIISGGRMPGLDFCQKIAMAFRMPLEDVLRHAGILPSKPEADSETDYLMQRISALSVSDKAHVLDAFYTLLDLIQDPATINQASVEPFNRFADTKFEDRPPENYEEYVELIEMLDDEERAYLFEAALETWPVEMAKAEALVLEKEKRTKKGAQRK